MVATAFLSNHYSVTFQGLIPSTVDQLNFLLLITTVWSSPTGRCMVAWDEHLHSTCSENKDDWNNATGPLLALPLSHNLKWQHLHLIKSSPNVPIWRECVCVDVVFFKIESNSSAVMWNYPTTEFFFKCLAFTSKALMRSPRYMFYCFPWSPVDTRLNVCLNAYPGWLNV